MIETRLLQYFLAIAEEQSITKAADFLHISQPTLSKQMMDLEASLGKKLLIRGKKKITLTEDGAYLRNCAAEILSLIEKAESSFREDELNINGDVYIGCGEHRSSFRIMELIKQIQDEYPGIHFHILSSNADIILERLDKGLLDVGFLLEPEIDSKYDYQMLPLTEIWGILMRKDSPLAACKQISLKDLTDIPLLLPAQQSNSNKTKLFLSEDVKTSNIIGTYNLIYNASLMVEAGIGYALCIDQLVNVGADSPLTFVPLNPVRDSNVYLFTKKYQIFSKAAKLFIDRLQEEFL